ncbi:ATP-dependent DNA helicase RecG [Sinomonas sp. JGH33]|uniref:Probable DNA 3'-5' helicase RecG n=1 Tax=Sinomonas terricola TaxID=3110330 RepID=A0ABU5TAG0_9MICC|nr:ATP-dependent DNA helicase RecG [Sinomonas sp. JGH33]MEA5456578.1 ATP-dependent DNA helicase RecG [Sinomonas sp. JGH33]
MRADRTTRLDRLIGAKGAKKFADQLGLATAGDLLGYFPRRYMARGELTPIQELPFDEDVTLVAQVVSSSNRRMATRKGSITEVLVSDRPGQTNGPSTLSLTFFNGFKASKQLTRGVVAMFSGRVSVYRGRLQLTNPIYDLLDPEDLDPEAAARLAGCPIPVYPATASVPSWTIAKAVGTLLGQIDLASLPEALPAPLREKYRLPPVADAYRMIHEPESDAAWRSAQRRFRFEEALVLQTALARRRAQHAALPSRPSPARRGGLLDAFDRGLPFELTAGQREVGDLLARELAASHPMNRLLQGEVGSGKTVVALRAMLQVVDDGGQAALLAPTEVLAAQHYASIRATLGPLVRDGLLGGADDLGVEVALLTGSQSAGEKKRSLLAAASGQAGIVVGTHALLSENVQFADLGLVVVDEQHRFGVEQRDALRAKSLATPHLLVMTATPIPRTVAMTVFGDLETSVLRELPRGRSPIATHTVGLVENPSWERRVWQRAREEVDAGRQVYVVCPTIGAGAGDEGDLEALDAATWGGTALAAPEQQAVSVADITAQLEAEPALEGVAIGVLHGRLDADAKTAAMRAFATGQTGVLVATTVVEVGVDVPNATLMVILDADRFGIAQLHQLRGRVGRGGHPGTCLLVTRLEPGHPSRERLAAVAASTDGFELAQKDLEFRREGDILGASQSGRRSTLRLLRVLRDAEVIASAREDAIEIVADDPDLERHPALASAIEDYLDPEREVFLERG